MSRLRAPGHGCGAGRRGGLILTLLAALCGADDPRDGQGLAAFRDHVAATLRQRCLSCHDAEAHKGGLDLSRRDTALSGGDSGEAIVPGRAEESLLVEKVAAGEMPPKGPALAAEELAAIRSWIDAGAPYEGEPLSPPRARAEDFWSLQPITRPEPPAVKDRHWVRNPIDAFILAKLEEMALAPAAEADRRTLIRRVTFDLTGLPPTPSEIDAFLHDPSPTAYENLVDRLLASPRYGERWARHWLDVVRFAESHGYETNALRPNAWPYRDYVIRAFNTDLPFNRFVQEQLAGDTLADADWLARSATGFLVGGSHDMVVIQTVEGMRQQRMDDLDDIVATTGTTFLGLTVGCARCHNHKFDPITQRDYYGLQAVFAGVQHAEREVPAPDADRRLRQAEAVRVELAEIDQRLDEHEPPARPDLGAPGRPPVSTRRNVERFAPVEARFVRFTVQATNTGTEPCLDELEVWTAGNESRNVALASGGAIAAASSTYPNSDIHRLEHLNDGRHGNGRSWISAVAGKGWAQVELPGVFVIDRVVWGRDREEKYNDRTATEYYIETALTPGNWRVVASSADREPFRPGAKDESTPSPARAKLLSRQDTLRKRLAELSPMMRLYVGSFAAPGATHVLHRGDPMQPGEEVAPSGVRAVGPPLELPADLPGPQRRLALARWIADPANPLPARVMVNRLWHYHFGRGLVGTPSDFGFNGERPTHPRLLDWLASEFLAGGGRQKAIHRLIVTSAAYRQAARDDAAARRVDSGNRFLWRGSPRRLEAEAIRDAMLQVAGNLDPRMGGPGYDLWEPNTNYVVVFKPRVELGPDTFRRMVYQFKPRSQADPTFGAFDCPDGGLIAPRRNRSTTALQALNLLNSRFVLAQAGALAERLEAEAGPEPEAQARRAFVLAFGREPNESELPAAAALIREHGAATLARALFNASEFLYAP